MEFESRLATAERTVRERHGCTLAAQDCANAHAAHLRQIIILKSERESLLKRLEGADKVRRSNSAHHVSAHTPF